MPRHRSLKAREQGRATPGVHGTRWLAGTLLVLSAAVSGCVASPPGSSGGGAAPQISDPISVSTAPDPDRGTHGVPDSLSIEGLGHWPLAALGVDVDGVINPPQGVVQWYDRSPRPGERGIAVIAGHVAWAGTPDAFARLSETQPGDEVRIVDDAGAEMVFRVSAVRLADKDDVMTDPDVWGESETARLAIVSCDETSVVEDGGNYSGNLVVEAELVSP